MPRVFARYDGDDDVPDLDFSKPRAEVVRDDPAPDPWKDPQDFRHERII
jgi:hypothetical protein